MSGHLSIAQAMYEADKPAKALCRHYIHDLSQQFKLLAQILRRVWNASKAVSIYESSSIMEASLTYSLNNYFGKDDVVAAMNSFELDEAILFTDISWSVSCDLENRRFHLEISGLDPETFEYSNEVAETTHPLTEDGYQALLIDISKTLNGFLSEAQRIAFFEEFSRHQGQQTLDFMLE